MGKNVSIRPASWTALDCYIAKWDVSSQVAINRMTTTRNTPKYFKRVSYLLVLFAFDFAVLPLFDFCFPTDSMDLVSSSSLDGSSYVMAKKKKCYSHACILTLLSIRNHDKTMISISTSSPSVSNYCIILKVQIWKLTNNTPPKFKDRHLVFC